MPIRSVQNRISTTSFNSRAAATLAASATFQGVGEDVTAYSRVGVSVVTDNATDGTLWMEVSHDNVNWGGPPRNWSDTRFAQPHMWEIVEPYFRIRYVNGTTEAINLTITTQYSANGNILLGHQLDENLTGETEGIAVMAVMQAENKDSPGNYVKGKMTADGAIRTSIVSALIDFEHDSYIIVDASTTTDRYDYYLGGLAGTKVAEITVTYKTTGKNNVLSTEKIKL